MRPSIIFICSSFLFGNILGATNVAVSTAIFVCLIIISLFGLYAFVFKYNVSNLRLPILIGIVSLILGMCRFQIADYLLSKNDLIKFNDRYVSLIGEVISEPVAKTTTIKVLLHVRSVLYENNLKKIKDGFIFAYLPQNTQVSYGDILIAKGTLEKIKNNFDDFNFTYYARKDKVLLQLFKPEVEVVSHEVSFLSRLREVKYFFEKKLSSFIVEPHSSLLSGMIISGKGALPDNLLDKFTKVGLVHVVVLSGFNVAIISSFFLALCFKLRLSLKSSFAVVVSALVLFVLIAGATPPVMRAVLMGGIVLLGKVIFKQIDANKVLFFVASILALGNPYSVPFDPSFQLSFLATFGVINFTPVFKKRLGFLYFDSLKEIAASTLGALVMVSPFILYSMGNFSLVAPFVNIIVLPVVPILMLFGFLTVAFSFFTPLSYVCALIVQMLSGFVFKVVDVFASLPFASITIEKVYGPIIVGVYIFILWFLYKSTSKEMHATLPVLTEPH